MNLYDKLHSNRRREHVDRDAACPGAPDIAFYLPSVEGGGAERAIVSLANRLAARGLQIELVLGNAFGPYLAEISPAVSLVEIGAKWKLKTIMSLHHYLRKRRPPCIMSSLDIANIQLVAAAKLSKFQGVLLISQRATIVPVYGGLSYIHRQAYLSAIRFAYPHADIIISNSRAAAIELHENFAIAKDKIITIQNQVDCERISSLSNEPIEDLWMSGEKAIHIIAVASLTQRKDLRTLIKALALVRQTRDVRLVILGEGPERGELELLADRLAIGHAVHLPGFDANPYRWMKRADMLVSTSIAEGFPNVIVEALALGMRVVATDCPGDTSEILEGGRWGRLVSVGDEKELARAIVEVLDDPSPPDGRKRVADFAPDKVTDNYLKAFMRGIAEKKARYCGANF